MNAHISIDGRKIGTDYAPYIIAEMSANHNGSIENAFKIIEQAKRCGADAVKLQTYTADTITLNSCAPEFMIRARAGHHYFQLAVRFQRGGFAGKPERAGV